MQIIIEINILGYIYTLPANRDLMKAKGPKHIPIYLEWHKYSLKLIPKVLYAFYPSQVPAKLLSYCTYIAL